MSRLSTKTKKGKEQYNNISNDKQRSPFVKVSFMFLSLVLSISLLVGGCTLSVQEAQERFNADTGTPTIQGALADDMVTKDKKTVPEETQLLLVNVIADGTYQDQVTYKYHKGEEKINISITVEDDVVTAASIAHNNPHFVSKKYIEGVNAALPELVVGKRIDELDIPKQVSGSSLTTAAFKAYVERIVEEH